MKFTFTVLILLLFLSINVRSDRIIFDSDDPESSEFIWSPFSNSEIGPFFGIPTVVTPTAEETVAGTGNPIILENITAKLPEIWNPNDINIILINYIGNDGSYLIPEKREYLLSEPIYFELFSEIENQSNYTIYIKGKNAPNGNYNFTVKTEYLNTKIEKTFPFEIEGSREKNFYEKIRDFYVINKLYFLITIILLSLIFLISLLWLQIIQNRLNGKNDRIKLFTVITLVFFILIMSLFLIIWKINNIYYFFGLLILFLVTSLINLIQYTKLRLGKRYKGAS